MDQEFQAVLREHLARYPLMQPQDCAKLAYQSALGPAHTLAEREQILRGLLQEWSRIPADSRPRPPEKIGNGLCRLYLAGTDHLPLAAQLAADLLCMTAERCQGTPADLEAGLVVLEAAELPGMAAWLAEYRGQGCPPVHHSAAYREAYHPHYRVMRTAYGGCFPALLQIAVLAGRGAPAVVAIDGRCGSGKTSLAELIRQLIPCNVVHMDDFYLPPDLRAENWTEITRLAREAVDTMLGLTLAHVGINCADAQESERTAKAICGLFGFPYRAGGASNHAGSAVECTKAPGPGTHGHIAIAANNLDRAIYHLELRGVEFDRSTLKTDARGRAKAVYVAGEFGGFAIHLVQK